MNTIEDFYLLIGFIIGSLYFLISGLNQILKISDEPILNGMFEVESTRDYILNMLMLVLMSVGITLTWPIILVSFILLYSIHFSYKK